MPTKNGQMARYGDDNSLHVTFYKETVYQEAASAAEGHPVYKDFDYVHIVLAGGKSEIRRPVKLIDDAQHPADPRRFPSAWAHFQNINTTAHDGFPLEQCPFLPKAEIMGLKAGGVLSVEQLANIPDSVLHNFGMNARKWRDMAIAYLDRASKNKDISLLATKYDNLLSDFEAMRTQFMQLSGKAPEPGVHKPEPAAPVAAAAPVLAAPKVPKKRGPKPKPKPE